MRLIKKFAISLFGMTLVFISNNSSVAEDRALVIGIDKYPEITLNGIRNSRDLTGAVADATNISNLLISHFGFKRSQVKTLLDQGAKKENIVDSFKRWLIDGTEPGDRALFFFAGHGAQTTDENNDEANNDQFDEAIAPFNTEGELGSSPVSLKNLIIDDEIGNLINQLKGREITIIIDACHSGTATRALSTRVDPTLRLRSLTPYIPAHTRSLTKQAQQKRKVHSRLIDVISDQPNNSKKSKTVVWTATTSGQLAFDHNGNGIFTSNFIKGINLLKADRSNDGKISVSELLNYVRNQSEKFCKSLRHVCRFGLTPTLEAPPEYYTEIIWPIEKNNSHSPIQNSQHSTKIENSFIHTNDFELDVEILPDNKLHYGQDVYFKLKSSHSGYLVLFDEGPDGKFRQIFPNKYSKRNSSAGFVRSNSVITLPDASYGFTFQADHRGNGKLIALLFDQEIDVEDLVTRNLSFETLSDADKLIAEIASRLYAPHTTENLNEANRRYYWAFKTVDYSIK